MNASAACASWPSAPRQQHEITTQRRQVARGRVARYTNVTPRGRARYTNVTPRGRARYTNITPRGRARYANVTPTSHPGGGRVTQTSHLGCGRWADPGLAGRPAPRGGRRCPCRGWDYSSPPVGAAAPSGPASRQTPA
eukprot:9503622-Pyramimonas_sp.AAC.1